VEEFKEILNLNNKDDRRSYTLLQDIENKLEKDLSN